MLFDKAITGAPQIKALGLSFEDGVEMIGKFEQSGLDSGKMLVFMSKASVLFAKDGKTLTQGLGDLQEKMSNAASDTEALTMASEIFGTRGGQVIFDAIKKGNLDLTELGEIAKNSTGIVGDTFDETRDPIDQAKEAMNQATLALSDVGNAIQITLLPAFEKMTEIFKRFKEWFTALSPEQQQFIVKTAMIAAAIGPLLVVLGTLMGSMTKIYNGARLLISGIKTLGVILGFLGTPIGLAVLAIVAFIAIFAVAFTGDWSRAWKGVTNIFGGIFEGLGAIAKAPLNSMIGLINGFIRGLSRIKIPKWVPGIGGKGFSISEIPFLAEGGSFLNGQAIVGEAGPELVTSMNGRTKVTPLSSDEKAKGISGASKGGRNVEMHVHYGQVNTNSPSEVAKLDRRMKRAAELALIGTGGIPE